MLYPLAHHIKNLVAKCLKFQENVAFPETYSVVFLNHPWIFLLQLQQTFLRIWINFHITSVLPVTAFPVLMSHVHGE